MTEQIVNLCLQRPTSTFQVYFFLFDILILCNDHRDLKNMLEIILPISMCVKGLLTQIRHSDLTSKKVIHDDLFFDPLWKIFAVESKISKLL